MSEETPKGDSVILLKHVRLSFPDLFEAVQFEGKGNFSYRASFLIDKDSENDKLIRAAIQRTAIAKWGDKAKLIIEGNGDVAGIKGNSKQYCYISGDMKAYDGYAGKMVISASRPKDKGRPLVLRKNSKTETLGAEDGVIYGGCFVNAKVSTWAQDNKFGQGMRATLIGVQFAADGDAFGGAPPATADGFEAETATGGSDSEW
jgi:hypothetical protein